MTVTTSSRPWCFTSVRAWLAIYVACPAGWAGWGGVSTSREARTGRHGGEQGTGGALHAQRNTHSSGALLAQPTHLNGVHLARSRLRCPHGQDAAPRAHVQDNLVGDRRLRERLEGTAASAQMWLPHRPARHAPCPRNWTCSCGLRHSTPACGPGPPASPSGGTGTCGKGTTKASATTPCAETAGTPQARCKQLARAHMCRSSWRSRPPGCSPASRPWLAAGAGLNATLAAHAVQRRVLETLCLAPE